MHRRVTIAASALTLLGLAASTAQAADSPAAAAADYVKARPAKLRASASDSFHQRSVISTKDGLQYVPYERSYKGLKVLGGDFVVVTRADGAIASTSVAQDETIDVSTTPAVTEAQAAQTATQQLAGVDDVESTDLIVDATTDEPKLAYETIVTGEREGVPSHLHVVTDARTGAVLYTQDDVAEGTATGSFNGPSPMSIDTTNTGSAFTMADPARTNLSCRNFTDGALLTGTDDIWGDGDGKNVETACADALYGAQREWDMLKNWLGRSGIDDAGAGFPILVGKNYLNATWEGNDRRVVIGRNVSGQWLTSMDVVGHELGHAIDRFTPGSMSATGVSEATGDIFGTLTEAYANQTAAYDPPDYTIGEEVNVVGDGKPMRYMYQPSLGGDPDCYSDAIPNGETHAAAGPFNHWFYLVAEGSNPTGKPASPTCDGSAVTGVGIQTAGKIFYNAMLSKTYRMTYLKYRTATLKAAKNLYPKTCAPFNAVKAAWDAVSVPAQPGDPTCLMIIDPPANLNVMAGMGTVYKMTASGPPGALVWSATGLPAGVTIDASTGLISGTPSGGGTSTSVVTVTSGSLSTSATLVWTVTPRPACAGGQKLGNPGFETATAPWTATDGVIGASQTIPAHGGTRYAWMNGYGSAHTDTLTQTVVIPSWCTKYTLSFWLQVASWEGTTVASDRLTVSLNDKTLATYSNLDQGGGWKLKSFDVAGYAGKTVTLKFTGTEDASLLTAFLIDDVALTAG